MSARTLSEATSGAKCTGPTLTEVSRKATGGAISKRTHEVSSGLSSSMKRTTEPRKLPVASVTACTGVTPTAFSCWAGHCPPGSDRINTVTLGMPAPEVETTVPYTTARTGVKVKGSSPAQARLVSVRSRMPQWRAFTNFPQHGIIAVIGSHPGSGGGGVNPPADGIPPSGPKSASMPLMGLKMVLMPNNWK